MNSRGLSPSMTVALSLVLSLLVLPIIPSEAETQADVCFNIPVFEPAAPWAWCWPPGASVQYYFTTDPDADEPFTEAEKNLYRQAFNLWNHFSGLDHNGSGVVFSEQSGDYPYEVRKVSNASDWSTLPRRTRSGLEGAITWVGHTYPLQDLPFIRKAMMIHEIGHSFGLLDCRSCQPCDASVMTHCTPGMLAQAPQVCDDLKIKSIGSSFSGRVAAVKAATPVAPSISSRVVTTRSGDRTPTVAAITKRPSLLTPSVRGVT